MKRKLTIIILLGLFSWVLWGNIGFEVNYIEFTSERLPDKFSAYKIAQVSDFHNRDIVDDLAQALRSEEPDIIALTGDFIDYYKPDMAIAKDLIEEIVDIAPVYYVSGNHEGRSDLYQDLLAYMEAKGVHIMENRREEILVDDQAISILGLKDAEFYRSTGSMGRAIRKNLQVIERTEDFSILLAHQPQYFPLYADEDIDLTLSGHVHGGQVRLPLIGGIFGPGQGFLPDYTSGLYERAGSHMIVSRGLGHAIIPVRINNKPELIIIELKKD